jgi:hypothetical protein
VNKVKKKLEKLIKYVQVFLKKKIVF